MPELNCQIAPLPTIESYLEWDKEKNQCKVEIQIPLVSQCICRHTRGISFGAEAGLESSVLFTVHIYEIELWAALLPAVRSKQDFVV